MREVELWRENEFVCMEIAGRDKFSLQLFMAESTARQLATSMQAGGTPVRLPMLSAQSRTCLAEVYVPADRKAGAALAAFLTNPLKKQADQGPDEIIYAMQPELRQLEYNGLGVDGEEFSFTLALTNGADDALARQLSSACRHGEAHVDWRIDDLSCRFYIVPRLQDLVEAARALH